MRRRAALQGLLSLSAVAALAPRVRAAQRFRIGYAAITWGGDDRQAIADIASLGFKGIQLRASAVETFGARPAELKELLAQHHLALVALSSGNLSLDPAREASELELHTAHARFLREVGGSYLQVIDERPKHGVKAEDYGALGRRLTDLGKRTGDLGIPLGYHHHIGSLGESPEAIDRILDAADPRYVQLILDTAHCLQGGGDPVEMLQHYGRSLLFIHLKDVEKLAVRVAPTYRFVELGRGQLDAKAFVKALDDIDYAGWTIVELDSVVEASRTPKQAGEANRRYLVESLGLTL